MLFSQHLCFDFIDLAELELHGLYNPFLPQLSLFTYLCEYFACIYVYSVSV